MKRFYLLFALSALFLCACEPDNRQAKQMTEKINALAPYSVGSTFSFVTADGTDTVDYVVNKYDISNNGCNLRIYDCTLDYYLDMRFSPVGCDTSESRLFVSLTTTLMEGAGDVHEIFVTLDETIHVQGTQYVKYGFFRSSGEPETLEFLVPIKSESEDQLHSDYLKLVHGRGIVEYTIGGVLWKAVTR
ncbi:MAG: hypothetical protein ACI3Z7_00625 [Candidatus Aphodosoma sp.]